MIVYRRVDGEWKRLFYRKVEEAFLLAWELFDLEDGYDYAVICRGNVMAYKGKDSYAWTIL